MKTPTLQELPAGSRRVLEVFEKKSGLSGLQWEIRDRPDGPFLVILMANPTERFFGILLDSLKETEPSGSDTRATLLKCPRKEPLKGPEVGLLVKTLSESLTISRHTFGTEFFSRYTRSVSGAEDKVISNAHHVVFGRRGAGKSSLLLYSMHQREGRKEPFVWIDMQAYSKRKDRLVTVDILLEVLEQASLPSATAAAAKGTIGRLRGIKEKGRSPSTLELSKLLPDIKRSLGQLSGHASSLFVYLDDFHVIDPDFQPHLLHSLYSVARGNSVFLKLSAIESFTKLWDPGSRTGMETPHDIQQIKLDYNLTMADKANMHISAILDAHALYCGLPSVRSLCSESDVLNRLVWVAAGVPRDALNIFTIAISKAYLKNQARVTVTDVNVAASELVGSKLKDIENDASGASTAANELLDKLRTFCVKQHKKNAFLIEIRNDDHTFELLRQLVDLRLLHVVNEGITKREAGRKYMALILDYGFYVGIRAAKSVDLFNKHTSAPKYQELRKLPEFKYSGNASEPGIGTHSGK